MRRLAADFLLLMVTFFWGATFVVVKDAVGRVGVFFFLTQRFAFAFLALAPVCLLMRRELTLKCLKNGLALGIFLFGAYAFETLALLYTTASNTAFLTGLNVVMVPLLGAWMFRHPINRNMFTGTVLAAVGIYLLSTGTGGGFNRGDLLGIFCALCVTIHIILTGTYARENNIYWLTIIQFAVIAVFSGAAAKLAGSQIFVWHEEILWALVVCVLLASVFAFLVQTSMQRFTSPTHTALIFCMEPVFAALYAYCTNGETLGEAGVAGALLILAGMVLAETPPVLSTRGKVFSLLFGSARLDPGRSGRNS